MLKTWMVIMTIVVSVPAAPAVYTLKQLPAGDVITMDADIGKWAGTDDYFIDSIRSVDNVYYDGGDNAWTPQNFQMKVYGAYDDSKVYFAVKVTADNSYVIGEDCCNNDNLKINMGGKQQSFYLASDGTYLPNPANPFRLGVTMRYHVNSTGNGNLPTYEVALDRTILLPFDGLNDFKLSVGSEDYDAGDKYCFVAIGAAGPANKSDDRHNPWDSAGAYPTFTLGTEMGPVVGVEAAARGRVGGALISVSPNPFHPGSTIILNSSALTKGESVRLMIYDVRGRLVREIGGRADGEGRQTLRWDGKDGQGAFSGNGLYGFRLETGHGARMQKGSMMMVR